MRILSLFLLFFCISINFAQAIEFIIKPKKMEIQAGENFIVYVHSTGIFLKEGHAELPPLVRLGVLQEDSAFSISLTENAAGTFLQGKIALMSGGPGLLAGQVLPRIWSDSPEAGMAEGDRRLLAEYGLTSKKTMEVEKFAKTLINSQANDTLFSAQIGHKLEIVLLNNPAEIKLGGKIKFQVFLDKKPIQLPVRFTYDGYSKQKNVYQRTINTDKKGRGSASVSRKGLWMLSTSMEKSFAKKEVKESGQKKEGVRIKNNSKSLTQKEAKAAEASKVAEASKTAKASKTSETLRLDFSKGKADYANNATVIDQQTKYPTINRSSELSINIQGKSDIAQKPKDKVEKKVKPEPTPKEMVAEPTLAEKEIAALKDFSKRQKKARKESAGKPAVDGTLLQANYIFEIK